MTRLLNIISVVALTIACATMALPNSALAESTKWIVIHNKTTGTISSVYFSEPDSDIWGSDFLGSGYIYPDEERRFNVTSNSCTVDLKVHFTNQIEHTLTFNICSAKHIDDLGARLDVAF